ncbi:MAG TPA: glycosyltransferase [Gemmataceae bacterium]|jgi:glycosyltransferase involved in cell wall biosynthesis|nr:glycosyltransferase [Gemmataceae bacterium]
MKVLHLIPDLEYGNAAKQLSLLAPALAALGVESRIVVMSGMGPLAEPLQSADINLEFLNWKRWIDFKPFGRLSRSIANYSPDIIHCWRRESVRCLALAGWTKRKTLASCIGYPIGGIWGKLESRLLRRLNKIVFQWPSEPAIWRAHIPVERMCQIPPGIDSLVRPDGAPSSNGNESLPQQARLILCMGPLEPSKGFKEAIWAFHILAFLYEDLRLVVIGEGPDRVRMNRMAHSFYAERVIFLGARADFREVLARAEVVWVPSHVPRGFNVALDAMAAAKPVIASRVIGLSDIVVDGVTGGFMTPGDKVGLARQTRPLLEDAAKRIQLGEAGLRRVQEKFSVSSLARAFQQLYESMLNSG